LKSLAAQLKLLYDMEMTDKKIDQKISLSRKISYGIIAAVLVLIILEITLRLAGLFPARKLFEKSQSSASWQENLFAGFMGIHEPAPELLWKMKPNLNKTFVQTNSRGLTGRLIPYEKDTAKLRILVLGDSTPLGIGLKDWDNSYVWLLQEFLERQLGREVEIVNASTAGYTSRQGLEYLREEGLKYDPDFVLVYLGNNDASYNGYLSDSALMAQASEYIGLKKVLNNFKIYRMLKSILIPLKSGTKDYEGLELQVRVPPHRFENNLAEIIEISRKNGAGVILNTIPVPLTWPPGVEFKVFTTGRDTVSGQLFMPQKQREILEQKMSLALDWEMFRQQYGQIDPWSQRVLQSAYTDSGSIVENIAGYRRLLEGDSSNSGYLNNIGVLYWQSEEYDSARIYLKKALSYDPADPSVMYNMGMTFLKQGMTDSADHYLRMARDYDYNSLRIKSDYNEIIENISQNKGIPLIDLKADFERLGREKLFVDHCHPNQIGHRIIAEQLTDKILEIINSQN